MKTQKTVMMPMAIRLCMIVYRMLQINTHTTRSAIALSDVELYFLIAYPIWSMLELSHVLPSVDHAALWGHKTVMTRDTEHACQ
jgi:presenilin-like A22 family membrane protease